MDNLTEQCEEIEALKSIYDQNFKVEEDTNSITMKINPNVTLLITLKENYPSEAPPNFELWAPALSQDQRQKISAEFQQIFKSNMGSPILFQWIEKLKEIVANDTVQESVQPDNNEDIDNMTKVMQKETLLNVTHGNVIQDRKSVFQGHASRVNSVEDTKAFLSYLLQNKKVAQATHNIVAYRILTPKGTFLQDCDDDGETHAGGRVLHLLQILDLSNVMVVVTRWYGGVHLGPDRFKHINNAARQVLIQGGFLPT